MGPPNDVSPSFRNVRKTSPTEPGAADAAFVESPPSAIKESPFAVDGYKPGRNLLHGDFIATVTLFENIGIRLPHRHFMINLLLNPLPERRANRRPSSVDI